LSRGCFNSLGKRGVMGSKKRGARVEGANEPKEGAMTNKGGKD